jgi:hypothetical protein
MGWSEIFNKDSEKVRRYLLANLSDDFVEILMHDKSVDIFELLTAELDYDSGTIYTS